MPNGDRLPRLSRVGLILLIVLTGQILFSVVSYAQPPIGAFYYPSDNIPPGPPPNYNQVDTSYFMGEPPIPLPPPDSGGVYVWVDSEGNWNLANHIYSQGNSLEQFHGSVLAMLDSPPEPDVNVFTTNFELCADPDNPDCTQCYKQNDRWGWYQWAENLYEIWWDVSTREWKNGDGDPNDFMKIMIVGCAIDFNVWSSGHGGPFDTDQIFLGSSMIRLSDVPGFTDTYPGIEDPYQSQAGDDPTRDPNITVFTPIEGTGASYNLDGVINSGQMYPCGRILGQEYGNRFAETFVYEGNGIQFSSSCLTDPCDFNNAPIAVSPDDLTMIVCDLAEICLTGFSYSDPDGNLLSVEVTGGTLNGETVCFNPVEGINTITLICVDECGAADTAITQVTVNLNQPPQVTCPPDISIDCSGSTDPSYTGYPTVTDDNDPNPVITYSDVFGFYAITRTWTVTDDCGSSAECDQIITLVDTTPPTITTCLDGFTVECVSEIPEPDINLIAVIDDCDPNPVVTHDGDISDGNSCPETITRTYRVTDASGNSDVCVQIITVLDTTPPTITCPPGITIECGASIEPEFTGIPSAGDNCGAEPVLTYADSQVDNVITRTWTATDLCGLNSSCDQIITLVDTTPPTITTCPDGFTVECLSEIPEPDINLITAIDDCDPNPVVTHDGDVSDGNSCPETITRTYRATDNSGNSDICVQIITVLDTTQPTITCPENLTIACSDPSDPDNTGYPTVSDNCEVSEITYSDVTTDELITRTWVAIDACGNTIDCEQLITIAENLPPIVECPTEPVTVITLNLEDEICFTDIVHYDPDGELESVLVNGVLMTGPDICFVPQNWGLNQVTIVCVDECGASTECSFTVIVGACYFLPGDANVDDNVNVADVLDMLNHLKGISDLPDDGQCDCYPNVPFVPFYGGADANGSCRFNVADVIHLFDILRGYGGEIQYCPLCPPTEGWLPPLRGDDGDPKPLLNSGMKLPANN